MFYCTFKNAISGKKVNFNVCASLKVPKRENFSLAFFALSEPI